MYFQLIFEVVRSGFDGRVAIDDVSFVNRECTVSRMCSFENQLCGFTTSGDVRWHHRNGHSSTIGPRTDHTLETPMGKGKSIREEVYDVAERASVNFPCWWYRLLHDGQHWSRHPSCWSNHSPCLPCTP